MKEITSIEEEGGLDLDIRRKAKGTVQVIRIALNKGAHQNLTTLRDMTKQMCGEGCSASILIRRALEVYITHLISIMTKGMDNDFYIETAILHTHLSKKAV